MKILVIFLCIFYTNYVQATYNTGIKTRVYEQQQQPITHVYHHQHHHDHQPYTSTHGRYHQYSGGNDDRDYQTSITQHSYQQQQPAEGVVHYQQTRQWQQQRQEQQQQPQPQHQHTQYQHHYHQQQQPQQRPQPTQTQPIYERTVNSQSSGSLQNSENSINEYYTGCPSGHTGQLPYAYDCRRFLNCWHGRGHIQTCSVGTVFNPETLECDRPDKVKCEAALGVLGVQTVGKSPTPSASHGSLKQPQQTNYRAGRYSDITESVEVLCPTGAQGLQPHPSDCTRFINCANGNMHIQQCGPGTAYSIAMKVCDFKNKVDCSGREAGEETVPAHRQEKSGHKEIKCPADASGLYAHPSDCTKFLQCSNGATYIQDCGPGTAFDSVRLICDYKHKVKCCSGCPSFETESPIAPVDSSHTQSKPPTSTSSGNKPQHEDLPHTSDILCPNAITGLFAYPFDYTKFINCKNGNTAIQNCVPGTAFSISKGYCEPLDDIEQSDHVVYIVSQVSYEYSQTLITCPPGTEGLHLYPFNAELYVKCMHSQMSIVPCGTTKAFSITRRTCLPRSQVLKHERVRFLSELQSTKNYQLPDEHYTMQNMVYCPGGLTGSYPHPFDSTKYLKCVRGRLFSESCASGEAFSLSRKVCSSKEDINNNDYVPQVKAPPGQEWRISDMEMTYGSIDGLTYLMCPPGVDGYFLNPFDCTKYIECTSGATSVDNCLNGAVFSISRQECIPRDKVEAYDRVEYMTTTKNEFSNEGVDQHHHELQVNCNPGTFGIYPHPDDCHKYIRCANGRLSTENCPTGKVFSLKKSYCHNEHEVDNADRSPFKRGSYTGPPTTTTNTVHQSGSYTPIDIPQSSLSPPLPTVMSPPPVVLMPPLPSAPVTHTSNNVNCPPGASGRYPHPYDCTKFLMCSNGETHVQDCGPGTAWNKAMEVCDFKDKVNCDQNGGSVASYKYNSQSQFECPSGVVGHYQHPYDWHKYLVCSYGIATVMDCAPGTVFSVTRKTCDIESKVMNEDRCNNGVYSSDYDYSYTQNSLSPTPPLMPPLSHTSSGVSCPPGSNGRYPHPYDCSKFIMCSNGETHVQDCGPGTVWNKAMEVCDFKERVDCSQNSAVGPVKNYKYNSESRFYCPEGVEGLYQHPYDWHKYLVCSHGSTTVMDCAPGTVFSLSRRTCDTEANVMNEDRCNNGLYSNDYDYSYMQSHNRGSSTVTSQWSNVATTQTQPQPSSSHTQVSGNRWTSMNVPRPQAPTTWQHTTNTVQQQYTPTRPETLPAWSGTAVNVDQHSPTHTVIYEEGSFEPNRNYHRQSFNTPSVPLKPTTTTSTPSTLVYAQPIGSQEDSQEVFSNKPNINPLQYPLANRQNHTRNLNPWTPIRPVDIPRHNLMPPLQGHSSVYTNTHVQVPVTSQLMPPQREVQPTPQYTGPQYSGPQYPGPQYPGPQSPGPQFTVPQYPRPHNQSPVTHLMPPFRTEPSDSGQRLIPESDFKVTPINIDQLPGQISYNLNDFDQQPSASNKHNINDASNLYGGLQPPLPSSSQTTTTTPRTFLDPYAQTTQLPVPTQSTTPTPKHHIPQYPHLSNATIQSFPNQPHYSPPYAEVTHSRNNSWVGRKIPQHAAVKPSYKDLLNADDFKLKVTSTPTPQYYGIPPPPPPPSYAPTREHEEKDPNFENLNQEEAMKEALKLLLKPYIDTDDSNNEALAEKAQSHIMSLVPTTSTTTTHKPSLPSNRNTLVPSSTPPDEDVELILAGEQHHLVGITTTDAGKHETTTSYDLHQSSVQSERSSLKPSSNTHTHDHSNWHKHHNHDPHHFKVQHSRDFHEKHPNLPNPFEETTNSLSSYNPRAEATTPRTYNFDLRFGGETCPFDCGNGKCVEEHQVCDGVNNCLNRKDEEKCEHLGYEMRLTGGQSSNMGRVEVKILGKWGYVCDDKFGLRDADVVCRELGFKMGAMEVRGNSYYAPTDVNLYFAMDEVECKGNETSLKECDFKGWGVNNCGPDEVVGVVCKVPKLKCPDNYWLCSTSKECIPTAFLCDVTPDCEDGSDESEQVCNAPIKYRLEGGRSSNEGRLEVFYRGEWGTVCDDDFGLKEAQVVCNSFGLYGKPEIAKNIYGPGSGPIWLDQVSCLGNETKIEECNHWSWGENNCNHTEDVGLKCTAGPKPNPNKSNKAPATTTHDKETETALEFGQSELDDLGLYQGLWQRSSKAINTQKKCGHFKSNLIDEYEHPEERVVNGTIAKRGRHPWQATIRTRGRGGISSHWCGAVVISKKLILTAAHCLAGYPKGSYFVRMGDHYANIAEASEVDANIENWYIHEKFRDQKHMNNDIALILLKTAVRFNDYVQPICLPEKGANLETNRMCTISGWGSIKSGTSTPSNILRSAQVPILADEVCSQKNVYANAMSEGMFCAGFLDESADACDGDSGGPLVCSDDDGETLYGIISWGQHCGYANHPGVYVRVEKYIDWIYDKINLMIQQGKL